MDAIPVGGRFNAAEPMSAGPSRREAAGEFRGVVHRSVTVRLPSCGRMIGTAGHSVHRAGRGRRVPRDGRRRRASSINRCLDLNKAVDLRGRVARNRSASIAAAQPPGVNSPETTASSRRPATMCRRRSDGRLTALVVVVLVGRRRLCGLSARNSLSGDGLAS